ncbi:hypothetical protein L1887_40749 [Cichorium endivia]|nr:hypothetical protein L1887_40749 [Cichorium endivia]
MNIFIMNPRKHLVFLVLFTFNFLLHSSMASSQVQSFPPQNFTLLGDSYLRHGIAGLTLESNILSASSGTITYTRPILGNFGRIHSCMIAKDDLGKSDSEESANDALTALDGTTFDGTMMFQGIILSLSDDGLHDSRVSLSDDGLHDSRLSLSDDGLHDSRETTVIDDDSVDSETVGSFCTMSQSERYISKVKALEAGKAAKRREDKKEKERRMKKEAFKMERERAKKAKEREMELNRKIKQEEMKKREADMAARKKQREKQERAKKRKEEKRWRL